MITTTLLTHNTITNMTGYSAFAEARLGSNGDSSGVPEITVGTDSSHVSTGRVCWDSDPSDGLDSGWTLGAFTAAPSGSTHSASWDVAGASPEPVVYSNVNYAGVFEVDLRAMTLTSGLAAWQSIDVAFMKNGVITDHYTSYTGPSVDDTAASGIVSDEQILKVMSSYSDNDSVVISGDMRLAYPEGIYPGPNDLADQIYVFGSGSSTVPPPRGTGH
jgi:hypothetical protein